jgi:hypothetical protein
VEGSIKIWNFGTGDQLKQKMSKSSHSSSEHRITDMHYSLAKNDLFLLVCEASNIIKMYLVRVFDYFKSHFRATFMDYFDTFRITKFYRFLWIIYLYGPF